MSKSDAVCRSKWSTCPNLRLVKREEEDTPCYIVATQVSNRILSLLSQLRWLRNTLFCGHTGRLEGCNGKICFLKEHGNPKIFRLAKCLKSSRAREGSLLKSTLPHLRHAFYERDDTLNRLKPHIPPSCRLRCIECCKLSDPKN